ncbi:unnamed protein product [Parnassius apollo]|uniref:(apollo) hypothetical protein n=1 Tax=Parnassius apollo TaxID=110799 RepID=A0A8S3WDG7_PARAO|nr:unnamed protein product [Parnassius apollo]
MVSYRMVLVLIFNLILRLTEGRVYCQDSHASPWIPLGYSCPVMCQNIINAIEQLKMIDYRKLLEINQGHRKKLNGSYVSKLLLSQSSEEDDGVEVGRSARTEPYHKDGVSKYTSSMKKAREKINYKLNMQVKKDKYFRNIIDNKIDDTSRETYRKMAPNQNGVSLFEYNKKFENVVPKTSHKVSINQKHTYHIKTHTSKPINIRKYTMNPFTKMAGNSKDLQMAVEDTCDWFKNKQPYVLIKKMAKNCIKGNRRNGYGEDFIRTLTRTMNRYALTSFKFTEDMVELVLEKVFGENIDLRNNVFDVGKLLSYLKNEMNVHKLHRRRDTTIVLKPRHCLSISVPGCFCRPGFVENAGQCVKPEDCFPDTPDEDYLSRIIVY